MRQLTIYSGGWEADWASWAVWASKIWFSTFLPLPGSYALHTWWVSNMDCCWGVFGVLGDFGLSGVISGVIFGQIGADSGAESGGFWPVFGHRLSENTVNGREGVA